MQRAELKLRGAKRTINLQYVISKPIAAYYYSILVGNPKKLPVLLASEDFNGTSVIGMYSRFEICVARR